MSCGLLFIWYYSASRRKCQVITIHKIAYENNNKFDNYGLKNVDIYLDLWYNSYNKYLSVGSDRNVLLNSKEIKKITSQDFL